MDESTKPRKRKALIFLCIIAVVACAVIVGSILLLGKKDDCYRIVTLPSGSVSDYADSKLNLYENGTFSVAIIYKNEKHFTGIGTYTKENNSYRFVYYDATISGYVNSFGFTYQIRDNKITFVLQDGRTYIFGK